MRRINTGTVGRPLLARLVSVDNKLSSLFSRFFTKTKIKMIN